MDFHNLRIKDIHCVITYNTSTKHWITQNRKNHFVGVQLSGSALHTFANKEFVLSRNCLYFFNQKDDYRVKVYEPAKAFSIHFTTYEEIDTDSFCIELSHIGDFISILEKAKNAQDTNNDLTTLSLLYSFCAKMELIRQKKYLPKDMRMMDAKTYIDAHFRQQDCLNTAVLQSALTARRFGELFRQNYDTTPNKYIIFRRVEYAKNLLISQHFSIAEIAQICGFSDIYYFSKVFKNLTGVSPTEYKNAHL